MGAQEEMQPQRLSSAWPWSAAAQEQRYSALAEMAFQGGLVCGGQGGYLGSVGSLGSVLTKSRGLAGSSKSLVIAWKPKPFWPAITPMTPLIPLTPLTQ